MMNGHHMEKNTTKNGWRQGQTLHISTLLLNLRSVTSVCSVISTKVRNESDHTRYWSTRWKSQSHNKTDGKHDDKKIIVVVFSACQLSFSLFSNFIDMTIQLYKVKANPCDKKYKVMATTNPCYK